MDRTEYNFRIMRWYADSAKTYTQTSMAALILPIVFLKQVLGESETARSRFGPFLIASWICFLVAIASGLVFQWLAPKFVDLNYTRTTKDAGTLKNNPGYVYGLMVVAFFIAAALFMIGACFRLVK